MGSEQENKESAAAQNPRNYGKIILTLENCLIPESKLDETPSLIDGLDAETEIDLRILGCELIQTSGILLKLPQVAMATGQVLFQRFFYSKSFVRHSMEATAMSCICLASKIEEAPRRIRDVINVFNHIKQVRSQKPITPVILDQNYINLKSQVIKAERRVLKELGFCVHVKHPHKLIVMYLKYLDFENHQEMMQIAWNFMNDSFRSDVFVRYQPETIACACIFLSARKLNIVLPTIPPWFEIFKVSEDDLIDVCYRICALYRRPKPNAEKLEAAVEELKKKYQEQRKKDRRSENSSPNITIVERTNGSHNAWGGFISRALPTTNNTSSSSSNTAAVPSGGTKSSTSKTTSNNDYRKSKSKSPRSHSPSPSRSKKGRYRSTSRDRSHSKSKQKRRNSRSSSRSSDSSYEKRSKKRDKKYSKSDDKHFSDRRDRDRHSRKNYSNDGKKDYGHYSYDKDSKYSSKSYGNGHRSRDKRR